MVSVSLLQDQTQDGFQTCAANRTRFQGPTCVARVESTNQEGQNDRGNKSEEEKKKGMELEVRLPI